MLLRPKTGLEDMIDRADAGHAARGRRAPRAGRSRSRTRCPTSSSTRSSRRSTATRATTCGCSSRAPGGGLRRRRRRPRGDVQALRAERARPARASPTRSRTAATNIRRSIHNFRAARRGGRREGRRSSRSSSTAPTRCSARSPRRTRNLRTRAAAAAADAARRRNTALDRRSTGSPARSARRSQDLRPTARALGADAAPDAAVPARDDAGHPRPAAAVRARRRGRSSSALRPAARGPGGASRPTSSRRSRVLNYLFNELAYNPPGDGEEGYLFWASWANHLGALVFGTQDAHGPIRRGTILVSCSTAATCSTRSSPPTRALGTITQLVGPAAEREQSARGPAQAGGTTADAERRRAAHRGARGARCRSRPRPSAGCS